MTTKACRHSRLYLDLASFSIRRLQCRFTSTYTGILTGDDLGPTRESDHQSFRVRKDAHSKDLPLPPSLDPIVIEKRTRWERKKERREVNSFTPFQKKVWANPYAHTLASPVRMCRLTSIVLPETFLTTIHIQPHPETDDPWFLPVSLVTDARQLGPSVRFVGRKFNTTYMSQKNVWKRCIHNRIISRLSGRQISKLVWREDMPELVLDLMQKRVVKKLQHNFSRTARLTPCESPRTEDIDAIDNVSCVLVFRSLRTPVADDAQKKLVSVSDELEKWAAYFVRGFASKLDPHASPRVTHSAPNWYTEPLVPRLQPRIKYPELEFRTTLWRGKKVPVYSLCDLLGEDKAKELIQGSVFEGQTCVIMKSRRDNVSAEIMLMQLQAFITSPGP